MSYKKPKPTRHHFLTHAIIISTMKIRLFIAFLCVALICEIALGEKHDHPLEQLYSTTPPVSGFYVTGTASITHISIQSGRASIIKPPIQ